MNTADYKRLKGAKTRQFCRVIVKDLGYQYNHTSGSHMIYTADNGPTLSIPANDTISPGVWRNIGKLLNLA